MSQYKWEEKKNPHTNPDTKDGGCGDFGENYKKKSNLRYKRKV